MPGAPLYFLQILLHRHAQHRAVHKMTNYFRQLPLGKSAQDRLGPSKWGLAIVLVYPGQAYAFFSFGISDAEFYTLVAIALGVIFMLLALVVYGAVRLVKTCKERKSLKPALLVIALIAIGGATTAVVRDNAEKRAAEYKRAYEESLARSLDADEATSAATRTRSRPLPKPIKPPEIYFDLPQQPTTLKGSVKQEEKAKDE